MRYVLFVGKGDVAHVAHVASDMERNVVCA